MNKKLSYLYQGLEVRSTNCNLPIKKENLEKLIQTETQCQYQFMIKFSTLHLYDKKSNSTISRDKKKRKEKIQL